MSIRTTRSSVTFNAPFRLKGFDRSEPPGTYEIETDEEIIEGNGPTAYRRVATLLYVHSRGMTRTVTVDPENLSDALTKDAEQQGPGFRPSSLREA